MSVDEFEAVVRVLGSNGDSWWHFEGRIPDTMLACMRLLRASVPTACISVELEKPGRQGLSELAAEADVVLYSRSWAEVSKTRRVVRVRSSRSLAACQTATDGAAWMDALTTMHRAGATSRPRPVSKARGAAKGLLACALGVQTVWPPCLSLPRRAVRLRVEQAAAQKVSVVGTVGADDTFTAGILYGLFCRREAWSVAQSTRFAVSLGHAQGTARGLRRPRRRSSAGTAGQAMTSPSGLGGRGIRGQRSEPGATDRQRCRCCFYFYPFSHTMTTTPLCAPGEA